METLLAMTILTMVSMVLAGLVMAVHSAQDYSQSLEEITLQSRATLERMDWMISQAGVYELPGEPPTPGLAVVNRTWLGVVGQPEILVVWSGGRDGGIHSQGVLDRLPMARELVVYAPDPEDPSRFVEITFPNNTSAVNFRDSGFSNQILTLMSSSQAEHTLLCDRVQTTELQGGLFGATIDAAAVRFELEETPTDEQITSTPPGTQSWLDLPWSQGLSSSTTGVRQVAVRFELQLAHRMESQNPSAPIPPLPFFGSFTLYYTYQP